MMFSRLLPGMIILFSACLGWASLPPVRLQWLERFDWPLQATSNARPDQAASFGGEHQGVALLAGGFGRADTALRAQGKPSCVTDIYALQLGATNWSRVGSLSQPIAEGLSAGTSYGVVCVGGGADGKSTARAFLLEWNKNTGQVQEKPLPDFPFVMRLGALATKGNCVYVVGGEGSELATSDVWMLDLDQVATGWRALPPLPGKRGRRQAQVFVQNGDQKRVYLYAIGGYVEDAAKGRQTFNDGFVYDLSQSALSGHWRPMLSVNSTVADIDPRGLMGAKCVTSGDQHVLFFGADDAVRQDVGQLGRGQQIVAYHTVTDRWFVFGESQCGTAEVSLALKRVDGSILLGIAGAEVNGAGSSFCVTAKFVQQRKFHFVNWIVIAVYFCGLAGMGIWFMRKKKSADDFFRGGGHMPWWAAGVSIFAAMSSSITFLAVPALAYMSDWRYFPKIFCFLLIPPLVIGCYLPFFRKLNLTCAYEYLELRFNLACRLFTSLAFNLFMVARIAVVSYLPSLVVSAVSGVDINICIVFVCLLTILYCASGGIEAVIWSDVVQTIVLVGGAITILGMLIAGTDGGFMGVFKIAGSAGKLKIFDFSADFSHPVIWVVLIGGYVEYLITYTSDQCVIQRYMTTKNISDAGRSLWVSAPFTLMGFVFFGIGTALYTFYHSNPERLDVTMPKADSILPMFMANDLPVGLAGLVMAGLFAATITTLAANLNSSATSITSDWFVRLRKKASSDRSQVRFAQLCTFAVGLAGMAGALTLANVDIRAVYDQFLKFIGIITSGIACLFMLGIFTRRVGATAALIGLAMNYIVCIGLDRAHLDWKPHLMLYGAIGILVCFTTAMLASVVFPNRKTGIDGLIWRGEK